MGFIGRAWRGEEKLWKVFWIYGVLVGIIFGLLELVVSYIEVIFDYSILSQPVVDYAYFVFLLVYGIWNMVASWRCAFNADWRIWGYILRVFVVLSVLGFIGGGVFYVLNASKIDASIKCQESAMQYESQREQEEYMKRCLRDILRSEQPVDEVSQSAPLVTGGPVAADAVPQATAPVMNETGVGNAAQPIHAAPMTHQQMCEKIMTDHALKNGADPVAYIAQNQDYVKKCVTTLESQKGQP